MLIIHILFISISSYHVTLHASKRRINRTSQRLVFTQKYARNGQFRSTNEFSNIRGFKESNNTDHNEEGEGRLNDWLHAIEYVGHLQVGNPPQEFRVLFDTGSGNLLLPSIRCDDAPCLKHKQYNVTASKTARPIAWLNEKSKGVDTAVPLKNNKLRGTVLQPNTDSISKNEITDPTDRDTQKIAFNSGWAYAQFVRDDVCLGKSTNNTIVVKEKTELCTRVTFLEALEESNDAFLTGNWDGVCGLGFDVSLDPNFNLVQQFTKLSTKNGIFTLYLGKGLQDGELSFGRINPQRFTGPLHWIPISHKGYWQMKLMDLSVGGKPLNVGCTCKDCCQAVVDSGSSLIMAPSFVYNLFMKHIGAEDECTNQDPKQFPSIGFILNDADGKEVHLELQPEDYMDRQAQDGKIYCWSHITTMGPTAFGPALVLGMPFLRTYYTVFDRVNNRMGFGLSSSEKKLEKKEMNVPDVYLTGCRGEDCHVK